MGLFRTGVSLGCNAGVASICVRKSGEALTRNQFTPSALIAALDCVRLLIFPARAARQFSHAQFHWGNPPPAAVPSSRTRVDTFYSAAFNSNRAGVTRALEKDRHGFDARFGPALFGGIFHRDAVCVGGKWCMAGCFSCQTRHSVIPKSPIQFPHDD
jgi:hypothetical protein